MKLPYLILLFSLTVPSLVSADPASEKEATKLLDSMKMDSMLEQSMSQMLNLQIQQNPALGPYKAVMLEFLGKHMSYESLKDDLVKMYAEAFTAAELIKINEFYSTDVGQKAIEKMPELMTKGGMIGASRVQENLGELQDMIKAEDERLQAQK